MDTARFMLVRPDKPFKETLKDVRQGIRPRSLDLSNMEIDVSKAVKLAEALKEQARKEIGLLRLDLGENFIKDKGCEHLADALKIHLHLWRLDLSNNFINKAVKNIAHALQTSKLNVLILASNEIDDESVTHLARVLKGNKNLTKINLRCNKIGDVGALHFAEAIKTNLTLTTLDLSRNQITEVGVAALLEGVRVNRTLTSLKLQGYVKYRKIIRPEVERRKKNKRWFGGSSKSDVNRNIGGSSGEFFANFYRNLSFDDESNPDKPELLKGSIPVQQKISMFLKDNKKQRERIFVDIILKNTHFQLQQAKLMVVGPNESGKSSFCEALFNKTFQATLPFTSNKGFVACALAKTGSQDDFGAPWTPEDLGESFKESCLNLTIKKLHQKQLLDKRRRKTSALNSTEFLRKLSSDSVRSDKSDWINDGMVFDHFQQAVYLAEDVADDIEVTRKEKISESQIQKAAALSRSLSESDVDMSKLSLDAINFCIYDFHIDEKLKGFEDFQHLYLTKHGVFVICIDMLDFMPSAETMQLLHRRRSRTSNTPSRSARDSRSRLGQKSSEIDSRSLRSGSIKSYRSLDTYASRDSFSTVATSTNISTSMGRYYSAANAQNNYDPDDVSNDEDSIGQTSRIEEDLNSPKSFLPHLPKVTRPKMRSRKNTAYTSKSGSTASRHKKSSSKSNTHGLFSGRRNNRSKKPQASDTKLSLLRKKDHRPLMTEKFIDWEALDDEPQTPVSSPPSKAMGKLKSFQSILSGNRTQTGRPNKQSGRARFLNKKLEELRYWLNVCTTHAPHSPIVLVGTKLDEALAIDQNCVNGVNYQLSNLLENYRMLSKNSASDLAFNEPKPEEEAEFLYYFPVSNTNLAGLSVVRAKIEEETRKMNFFNQEVRLRYLNVLDSLLSGSGRGIKKKNTGMFSLSRTLRLARELNIVDEDEVKNFLQYFHEVGMLFYIPHNTVLKQRALQMNYDLTSLVRRLQNTTRKVHYHNKDSFLIPSRRRFYSKYMPKDKIDNQGLSPHLKLYCKKRLLSRALFDVIFGKESEIPFRDFFLNILLAANVLIKWPKHAEPEVQDDLYLVPALLSNEVHLFFSAKGKQPLTNVLGSGNEVNPHVDYDVFICGFDFEPSYLPKGIFHRIIAELIDLNGDHAANSVYKQYARLFLNYKTLGIDQEDCKFGCVLRNDGNIIFIIVSDFMLEQNAPLSPTGLEERKLLLARTAVKIRSLLASYLARLKAELQPTKHLHWREKFCVTKKKVNEKDTSFDFMFADQARKLQLSPWFDPKLQSNLVEDETRKNLDDFLS